MFSSGLLQTAPFQQYLHNLHTTVAHARHADNPEKSPVACDGNTQITQLLRSWMQGKKHTIFISLSKCFYLLSPQCGRTEPQILLSTARSLRTACTMAYHCDRTACAKHCAVQGDAKQMFDQSVEIPSHCTGTVQHEAAQQGYTSRYGSVQRALASCRF